MEKYRRGQEKLKASNKGWWSWVKTDQEYSGADA